MYYQLHEHCKLVMGTARGAIYDLHSGKVYSVNQSAAVLLNHCIRNESLDLHCLSTPAQIHFFDTLTQKGLGGFYLAKRQLAASPKETVPDMQLNFVWLELTAKCNNRCLHCYTDSNAQETNNLLSLERYLSLLHEIRSVGCSAIQLIGGEPLLYPHWRMLIEQATAAKYEFIELFTNATLITDEILDFLGCHNVHIATTIYADCAEIHDQITQNTGSFAKTIAAIKKIRQRNLPLRIASILMKNNEHEGEKIMQLCQSLGVDPIPPDIIRPTGRGNNRLLLPDTAQITSIKPPFYTAEPEFQIARFFHPCLAGKIAIAPDGDVFPCIFARNQILGNITNTSLTALLATSKLQSCWNCNKDKITKCKDCEYRYACPDCRPKAQCMDAAQDWLAAPSDCSYNPYTGIWQSSTPIGDTKFSSL